METNFFPRNPPSLWRGQNSDLPRQQNVCSCSLIWESDCSSNVINVIGNRDQIFSSRSGRPQKRCLLFLLHMSPINLTLISTWITPNTPMNTTWHVHHLPALRVVVVLATPIPKEPCDIREHENREHLVRLGFPVRAINWRGYCILPFSFVSSFC